MHTPNLSGPVLFVLGVGVDIGVVVVVARLTVFVITVAEVDKTTPGTVLVTMEKLADICESSAAKFVWNPRSSLNLSAAAPVLPRTPAVF